MAEKIVVPVEIGGPEAVRSVRALTGEVDKLEKSVDKLADKAGAADDALDGVGRRGGISARGLGEAFVTAGGAVTAFTAAAVAAGVALGTAAGRGEDNLRAVNALGSAYDEVRRATSDTVTAQQAFATQQRLVRSGLQVSTTQLGVITRAARDYARATGTDATQATEQLADALVGASADELQKYGISLQSGLERTEAFAQATRQLAQQQEGTSPAARTLSEDMERLGTATTQAASAFAMMAADGLGLQGIVSGLATRLRQLTEDINDAITASRNASRTEADVAQRGAAISTFQAAQREARAAFIERGGTAEQFARALPPPDTLNRLTTAQLERAAGQLRTRFAGTRSTAGVRGAIAAAERERLQGRRFGAIDGAGLGDLFGAGETATAAAPSIDAREREAIISDLGAVIREMTGDVASNARPPRPPPRPRAAATSVARTATDLTTAAMEAAHREAQRLRGTGVSAPTMSTMFEQAQAAREAEQTRERTAREAAAGRLTGRIGDTQRAFSEAAADLPGQAGFFDDLTGAGEMRRAEMLRSQADAMRELVTEVDGRIAQAREQGAAESEINGLLSQRVGLVTAANTADRERAAIERERLAPMRAYRDEMVQGLSAVGNAFVESAALALEGEEAFGQALQRQLRAVLVSLAKQSAVEALKNTALGVAAFAGGSVPQGLAYLKAAGLWAATGVAAGVGAAAIPRVDSAAAQAGGGGARTPAPAQARAGGASQESSGPLVLNINVSGALLNEGVEESIVRALDRAATRGVSPRVLRAGRGM
jgi:hypothetical protein